MNKNDSTNINSKENLNDEKVSLMNQISQEGYEYLKQNKDGVAEEIADVLYYVLLMSHDLNIDIIEALDKKITKNESKYPVEKAKGNHKKYNEIES